MILSGEASKSDVQRSRTPLRATRYACKDPHPTSPILQTKMEEEFFIFPIFRYFKGI